VRQLIFVHQWIDKTSLLKILAGLSAQEQGTIHLDDHPVKSEEYQNAVFYLGHLSALSAELSCLENLKYLNRLSELCLVLVR
jgi:heme exporter protein A